MGDGWVKVRNACMPAQDALITELLLQESEANPPDWHLAGT